jgi:hypothetical protein
VGWRKLRNERINDFFWSLNILLDVKSLTMRWVEDVACMWLDRSANRVLMGKPEGKKAI